MVKGAWFVVMLHVFLMWKELWLVVFVLRCGFSFRVMSLNCGVPAVLLYFAVLCK